MNKNKNYIICAAVWYDDKKEYVHQPKNIKTGFVVCGRRHHNCIETAYMINKKAKFLKHSEGFLTSDDRFVIRKYAAEIAFNAGQTEDLKTKLYSEDIY